MQPDDKRLAPLRQLQHDRDQACAEAAQESNNLMHTSLRAIGLLGLAGTLMTLQNRTMPKRVAY